MSGLLPLPSRWANGKASFAFCNGMLSCGRCGCANQLHFVIYSSGHQLCCSVSLAQGNRSPGLSISWLARTSATRSILPSVETQLSGTAFVALL